MRRVSLAEALAVADPSEAAAALAVLIASAGRREPGITILLDALASALADRTLVPYELRREIYEAAKRLGRDEVARLFLGVSPTLSDSEALEEEAEGERRANPRGRALTLGERKSLARAPRRELLEQLLHDPSPEVAEILLDNPHLAERDVLVIASRRPQLARTLEVVFQSERWGMRYRIKRALVMNPHAPLPLAARLMLTLRREDLKAVADDGTLSAELRLHARQVLEVRGEER